MAWTLENTTDHFAMCRTATEVFTWIGSFRRSSAPAPKLSGWKAVRFSSPVPNETSVGGYSNTNLSANYDLSGKVSVYLRADNLLNSRYHEYIGFPNPGAAIRLGLLFRVLGR